MRCRGCHILRDSEFDENMFARGAVGALGRCYLQHRVLQSKGQLRCICTAGTANVCRQDRCQRRLRAEVVKSLACSEQRENLPGPSLDGTSGITAVSRT